MKPVNQQDMVIFPESLTKLVTFTKQIDLELQNSSFTLDSGFDSKKNKDLIKEQKLVPVIMFAIIKMYHLIIVAME